MMKIIFLYDFSIHNKCLKLQKVDKSDGTGHDTETVPPALMCFPKIMCSAQKNGFHHHNLISS